MVLAAMRALHDERPRVYRPVGAQSTRDSAGIPIGKPWLTA